MPWTRDLPNDLQSVHIMGIGGTAMASLAGMLVDDGVKVTGSDAGVYPPMSDYLEELGIDVMIGYNAENLAHKPDLVVVGNVIRAVYPEAQALIESDLPYTSFPAFLGGRILEHTHNIVVSGTHGKTTTTALIAWLLESAGKSPGFLIGGRVANFDRTARRGKTHFVIEGDEYDTAFFDKVPKFTHYRPKTAILTSVEFDHADIYDDLDAVKTAFKGLVSLVPDDGLLVARADHEHVRAVIEGATCPVRRYGKGLEWDGRIESVDTHTGTMTFAVLHAGRLFGTFTSGLVGEHNLYNQVAAVAALEAQGLNSQTLSMGFQTFGGIKRRQEVIGEVGGITVVDDFAHHPTAVKVTLDALRLRFGKRRLWAIFEARSNTSRRRVFQQAYAAAFDAADLVIVAPTQNQGGLAEEDRFDTQELLRDLHARGAEAYCWGDGDANKVATGIAASICANAMPEDVIAILSNGAFGGVHQRVIQGLQTRFPDKPVIF